MTNKKQVQIQFGAKNTVDDYASSAIHAKGESLALLIDLIHPQAHWQALDVATGAGHTALRVAPHVSNVIATDLTAAMLAKTSALAAARRLTNIETRLADAEALPFDDATFNLVTCRLALHHFPHAQQALNEFARVLKPGGFLGLTDNIVVPDKSAASYYNAYEKLRDPSHNWVYPLVRLEKMLAKSGVTVQTTRKLSKELEFHGWADRQNVTPQTKEKLLTMMRNLPPALEPLFTPRWADDTLYFSLWEAVIVAIKNQVVAQFD